MVLQTLARVPALLVWTTLFFLPGKAWAQAQGQPPADQSTYTFRADTHIVLADITVMDAKGNPVHGLPQSAFHIFDNNTPQVIASFEEHAEMPATISLQASASSTYSNDYLLHLPPVLNIILIDIANLELPDQMYLNYELTKFLNEQPEGQPLAIYLRAGSGCFLVQNFTSDHKLLLAAVHKAIPRFPPLGRRDLSHFDTLHEMALSLEQLPGRKNILWFSGGSTLYLLPDAAPLRYSNDWRALYDELDQERIAIYPIDARGLTTYSDLGQTLQHMAMNDVAQATGGQALYNNNGLKEAAEHFLNTDISFYTLTYSPRNLKFDNKWHKLRAVVDGGSYHLGYRSGYFADGTMRNGEQPPKVRTRLLANGEKLEVTELRDQPIIFQARVLPSSDASLAGMGPPVVSLPPLLQKKRSVPFSLRYTVPLNALTVNRVDGKDQIAFGVASIVLNRDGSPVAHHAEQVKMVLKEGLSQRNPSVPITLDQQLNLTNDDQFLNLGVWDMVSGRFGALEVPLEVHKPGKH